jgi:hypothetical protein
MFYLEHALLQIIETWAIEITMITYPIARRSRQSSVFDDSDDKMSSLRSENKNEYYF